MNTLTLKTSPVSADLQYIEARLLELCKLQSEANKIKEELGSFLTIGESTGCPLGKLTMMKAYDRFYWTKAGEAAFKDFKVLSEKKGMGHPTVGSPQLRLTLNESK